MACEFAFLRNIPNNRWDVNFAISLVKGGKSHYSAFQIRGSIDDNSKIIFLISHSKHVVPHH